MNIKLHPTAEFKPVIFGTRTGYEIPFCLSIPANTLVLSAICGTHFALTKLLKTKRYYLRKYRLCIIIPCNFYCFKATV